MSIKKTKEYKSAREAYDMCFDEHCGGSSGFLANLKSIFRYENALVNLADHLLKEAGVQEHEVEKDRNGNGHTFYSLNFINHSQKHSGIAKRLGVKIPPFRFHGGFELTVNMMPDDVICEVNHCIRERDKQSESVIDLLAEVVKAKGGQA